MQDPKKIIVALDFADAVSTLHFLEKIDSGLCRVKVGKELFTRCGPALVKQIQAAGFEIFLDLKFHDIPNTVAGAVRAAVDLGVWMLNVHAAGGRAMMDQAREALANSTTLLTAVTVLTSLTATDLEEIGVAGHPEQQVLRLARLTSECGLHGVVCSAQEINLLRNNLAATFLLVTPGIRPTGGAADDQKRIETPARAIAKGSNYLVIGRPITQSKDPCASLVAVLEEIQGKMSDIC